GPTISQALTAASVLLAVSSACAGPGILEGLRGSARLPSVFMRDRIDHRAPPESRALAAAPGCDGCTRCVCQRGQRVLYGDDGQPGALQALDHRRPGQAAGAVNQHGAGFGSRELGLVLHRLYGTVRNVPGLA